MRTKTFFLGFLIMLALAGPAFAGHWDKLSSDEKDRLLKDDVIYKSAKTEETKEHVRGNGISMIVVRAPIDKCWEIFTRFNDWDRYWPKVSGSAVVEREPGRAKILRQSRFVGVKIEYLIGYEIDDKNHHIKFALDPSWPHDIENTSGYFCFEKIDQNATLFIYCVEELDTGLPVPPLIQEALQKRDLPQVAENVKKRIESGGEWKKLSVE